MSSGTTGTAANGSTQEQQTGVKESVLNPTLKKEITILLIGETGAGKTAFMSLLVNLFMGNGPYELEERNNAAKEAGGDKSQSQTNDATLYSVRSMDGTVIRILDTPGLADTRGIDQDEAHKAKINKAIQDYVTTIDSVLIMANGTVQRLGVATDYTLNVITAMFPHSIIDNIGFIFTHTDPLTFNFQKDSLQPELREAKHWLIQNPLAYYQAYKRLQAQRAADKVLQAQRGPDKVLERGRRDLEQFYDDTVDTLNDWLAWLDARHVQPSRSINELYQMSNNIEANIERALTAITRQHDERVKWEQIQYDLDTNEKSQEVLERLKAEQTAPFWDRQTTTRHNTLCILPGCHGVCHETCGLQFLLDVTALGRDCAAFSRGRNHSNPIQSVCDGCGHKAESHRHYNDKWVYRNKEISPDTKKLLDASHSEEDRLSAAKAVAKQTLDTIASDMATAQETIRSLIDQYNSISLSKNFAGHIQSAISMLEYRKKELQSNPNTKPEVDLIDESLVKLREKLKIIKDQDKGSGLGIWDAIKGVFRSS
ncbi:hypothetical protein RSOLAG22IIIB_07731 [Rhizoctonia solani]|uniref:AIG1-type G domain-containing protein n=1 Tax=Rhizoctonia solani TaxID=456999 RepID=A0A0K6FPP3_9AGAM|nr:hypothetical protein RSOLAG22IIIB_07731 [Rhizoctonia solani]